MPGKGWSSWCFDRDLHAIGGPQVADIAAATRLRGTIVIHGALSPVLTPFPLKLALRKNLSLRGYIITPKSRMTLLRRRGRKAFLPTALRQGSSPPRIDRSFTLDEIADAHAYLESGRQFGKVVVIT